MKNHITSLVAIALVMGMSVAARGSVVTIPSDYGVVGGETNLFDPLDGTGTGTFTGGANTAAGLFGDGAEISQNKSENVNWASAGLPVNEGTFELYWKVPTGGVTFFSTFGNMIIEDGGERVQIMMPNNDTHLLFQLWQGSKYNTVISTNNTWNPDQSYHLAFTWSAAGMKIFVDGVEDASIVTSTKYANLNQTMYLGARNNTRVPLTGIFDSFRISSVANTYVVPEPASMALLTVGGLLMLKRRRDR